MPSLDLDWRLRLAAFDALRQLRDAGGVVRLADLEEGFEFEGDRIPLMNARRGIWRPRQLGQGGAALSVVTTPAKRGKAPPYDDQVGSDEGWFVYRYEGDDPAHWTNRAVRRAMELRRPRSGALCRGDGGARRSDGTHGARLRAGAPAPRALQRRARPGRELAFYLEADVSSGRPVVSDEDFLGSAPRRAYATTTVKVRLRDERGRPEAPAGRAFDADILGVDAGYRIHIRRDVLEEHDGPMLRHGLQEMDRQAILLPAREALRPNREYLEERFERFRAA